MSTHRSQSESLSLRLYFDLQCRFNWYYNAFYMTVYDYVVLEQCRFNWLCWGVDGG